MLFVLGNDHEAQKAQTSELPIHANITQDSWAWSLELMH